MILESKEQLAELIDQLESGAGKGTLFKTAALWLMGEIEATDSLIEVFKKVPGGDEGEGFKQVYSLHSYLITLVTGLYLDKWAEPNTHQQLLRECATPHGQRFFFSNMGELATIQSFSVSNAEELLEILLRRRVIDTSSVCPPSFIDGQTNKPSEAFVEFMNYDLEYLKQMFKYNHWMLLLFFSLNAFRLLGYDSKLAVLLSNG